MQIILDKSAAINLMFKYATKGEKAGVSLCQLFRDIVETANDIENPQTKIRSLMLRSIAGKRDIGQCEVSRLLLSEKMYHSTFNYVTINTELDVRELNLTTNSDESSSAFKQSLIDFYAKRKSNFFLRCHLEKIKNFITFAKLFKINNKNQLEIRPDHRNTVVISYPKIRFNKEDFEKYKLYSYYQMIKYSEWDIANIKLEILKLLLIDGIIF